MSLAGMAFRFVKGRCVSFVRSFVPPSVGLGEQSHPCSPPSPSPGLRMLISHERRAWPRVDSIARSQKGTCPSASVWTGWPAPIDPC